MYQNSIEVEVAANHKFDYLHGDFWVGVCQLDLKKAKTAIVDEGLQWSKVHTKVTFVNQMQ